MIQFKLGKQKIKVSSSWDDISFRQFLEILNLKDDSLKAVSICSGIDYEILKKSEIPNLETILQAIQFLNTPANFPDAVTQIGKYNLPLDSKGQFNPQFKRLDQFEDMRKAMVFSDKGIIEVTKAYATYVSIYLQALRDGHYSYDSATAMVEEVMDMPAKEVIPAGSFFLIKLLSLSAGIKKTFQNTSQSPRKLKLASKNSKKRSGSMRPSRKSRRK